MPSSFDISAYTVVVYATRGSDPLAVQARNFCIAVKNNRIFKKGPAVNTLAKSILKRSGDGKFFNEVFDGNVLAIPIPRSSKRLSEDSLWPSLEIAKALADVFPNITIDPCVIRTRSVPSSSRAGAGQRVDANGHAETLAVDVLPSTVDRIILVDDLVTKGQTLGATAYKVRQHFGDVPIVGVMCGLTMGFETNYPSSKLACPRCTKFTVRESSGQLSVRRHSG